MTKRQRSQAFYELVWPHRATVLRTASMLVRDAAEAEDLTQETLLRAHNALDRFLRGTDMRAWLMRILRNLRIDRLRSARARSSDVRLERIEFDPPASEEPPPSDAELWNDPEAMLEAFSDRQVITALQSLPEEIRWTLLLVDVEGLDHADAAEILDVPVGTVKSRAHRGRRMLRESLLPVAREMRLVRE